MYRRGDIVLIPFPYTDLTGAKKRPALIISNDKLAGTDKICCLITSKKPEDGLKIPIDLPFESWVKPHRVFTVHTSIINKKIATISDEFHKKVVGELLDYCS